MGGRTATRARTTAGVLGRRTLPLPATVVAASLALVGCSPGVLDDDPPAASPSSSAQTQTPTPEPTPEGERFDGVDLAATLVPLPFDPPAGSPWGAWATEARDPQQTPLDPAAFAADPQCQAAVETLTAFVPEEVVIGGQTYEGAPWARVAVSRMASADDAQAYLAAVESAGVACDGVEGVATREYGVTAITSAQLTSELLTEAGMTQVAYGNDGSFHYSSTAYAAIDELIVSGSSEDMVEGWDAQLRDDIQTEIAALDAAAPQP